MLDNGKCAPPIEPNDQAIQAVQAFEDHVNELTSTLPREDWDMFFCSGSLYHLISLSGPAVNLASRIMGLAQEHGLVSYDPQTDTLTLPEVLMP